MKRKFNFSIYNYFEETCPDVIKLQAKIKALLGTGTIATFIATDAKTTLIVALGSFIVNEVLGCLKIVKDETITGI